MASNDDSVPTHEMLLAVAQEVAEEFGLTTPPEQLIKKLELYDVDTGEYNLGAYIFELTERRMHEQQAEGRRIERARLALAERLHMDPYPTVALRRGVDPAKD